MFTRVLSLVLLIMLTIAPLQLFESFTLPEVQLVVATVVMGILVIYDVYCGFILALGVIILYYRIYGHGLAYIDGNNGATQKGPMASLVTNYITPEHLKDAQDNTVASTAQDTEIIGIKGVYGEPVWGAQGLDKTMPGYEANHNLTGDYWSM